MKESIQISKFFPLLGYQLIFFNITLTEVLHRFHIEVPDPNQFRFSILLRMLERRYFWLKAFFHYLSSFNMSLHITLSPNAMFIKWISLIPRPL